MRSENVILDSIERVKAFVNKVSRLECDVDIISGRYVIDAKSIMGIFSMDLSKPVMLNIHADGETAEKALHAIEEFVVK